MSESNIFVAKTLLESAVAWFHEQFGQNLLVPLGSEFPNYRLPREIHGIVLQTEGIRADIQGWQADRFTAVQVKSNLLAKVDHSRHRLFKQIILLYRRYRAAETEQLTEKTHDLELATMLEQDVKALDALVGEQWLQDIEDLRLPRLKDFLPVQYIESARTNQVSFPPRVYDEKFHILQAPSLFLPDLAYFRAKCEDRDRPLAVAFLDIDHFKQFNTLYTETKIDRNLLPRFMQTVEAHLFHHGYAYRQGGDEYLMLIPSFSKSLTISFLDELRLELAGLKYPEIEENTTVSIGLCIVEPDCPLTDRELRERAGVAKNFAKVNGRNCVATYGGTRFIDQELQVVKS